VGGFFVNVLAIASQKGGVGKTTSAVALAGFFAQSGPTLLVDMDPQGNSTIALGKGPADFEEGLMALFQGASNLIDHVLPISPGLHLLPTDIRLSLLELDQAREGQYIPLDILAKALAAVSNQYQWVVIDTPPSLGSWTLNALNAANRVLIPLLGGDPFALIGLNLLLNTIHGQQRENPGLRPLGIVRTRWDERPTLSRNIWESVTQQYPRLAMDTYIPTNIQLSEAIVAGSHIATYKADATGAIAYRNLAKEVIERW
jgi:chromosome partitioning protein